MEEDFLSLLTTYYDMTPDRIISVVLPLRALRLGLQPVRYEQGRDGEL